MRTHSILCFALGATSAFGAQLSVNPLGGAQFTDLQAAIEAASAGDVIVVAGGCHRGIVVDKALTIIGSGTIRRTSVSCSGGPFPTGSGIADACDSVACPAVDVTVTSGSVTIAGFTIEGWWDAGYSDSNALATIRVAGTTELRIYDCTVTGPRGFAASGIAVATAAAIDAPGSVVTVARSQISGGVHAYDGSPDSSYWLQLAQANGPPGIVASQVNVLENTAVWGGTQGNFTLHSGDSSCPPSWPAGVNPGFGTGGPGIVASKVYSLGFVGGGFGTQITSQCSGVGTIYNQQPQGQSVVAAYHQVLAIDFIASGALTLGATWSLTGFASGGFIVIGVPTAVPFAVGVHGSLWVLPPFLPFISGNHFAPLVPQDSALLGIAVGAQWMGPTGVLSQPIFQVVRP